MVQGGGEALTGEVFTRRLFDAARDYEADPSAHNKDRVMGGIEFLDELEIRTDAIGVEARKMGADLRAYWNWKNSGDPGKREGLIPDAPFQGAFAGAYGSGEEPRLIQNVTTQANLLGNTPSDSYLISKEFAAYVLDDGRPESHRRMAILGQGPKRQPLQQGEDGRWWVESSDGVYEEIPYEMYQAVAQILAFVYRENERWKSRRVG